MSSNKQGGRNWRNRKKPKNKSQFQPEKPVYEDMECSLCGKMITEMITALPNPADNKPAHFECVLNHVSEREEIRENEKIVYMGSGNFAVVDEKEYQQKEWIIKRKIRLEPMESPMEWKEKMKFQLQ